MEHPDRFRVGLVFVHMRLTRYVIIEPKTGKFQPDSQAFGAPVSDWDSRVSTGGVRETAFGPYSDGI